MIVCLTQSILFYTAIQHLVALTSPHSNRNSDWILSQVYQGKVNTSSTSGSLKFLVCYFYVVFIKIILYVLKDLPKINEL